MNLTTEVINQQFSLVKNSVTKALTQAEEKRLEEQRLETLRVAEQQRERLQMQNDIRLHAAALTERVKEIFARPSELSQFLLEKVLSKTRFYDFLIRQVFVKDDSVEQKQTCFNDLEDGLIVSSGHMEDVTFRLIDLVNIDSLSSERNKYVVALAVPCPKIFQVEAEDLCQIEVVAYEHKQEIGGFEYIEESFLASYPPADLQLWDVLQKLQDLNLFCTTILKRYQHLITS